VTFDGLENFEMLALDYRQVGGVLPKVEATGVDLLIADCPGCVLQLRDGLDKRRSQIRFKHIADAVAEERPRAGKAENQRG